MKKTAKSGASYAKRLSVYCSANRLWERWGIWKALWRKEMH